MSTSRAPSATVPPPRMTVDEFLLWSEDQPGRYELVAGVPVRMQSELTRHARAKNRALRALESAIAAAGLPCEAWPDGASLRIDEHSMRQPDAMVTCGERIPDDVVEVTGAVIVVEVLSPTNAKSDKSLKLADYLRVPSVHHYLIIAPEERLVIHHRLRHTPVLTEVLRDVAGAPPLVLDPPGLILPIAALFPPR
jgi:Uma2 family endonuclease